MKPIAQFHKAAGVIANILQLVAGWLLLVVAICVTINAIARYGFGRDVAIITEAGGYVFLYVTFLALAGAYIAGQHVAVEIIDVIGSPRFVYILRRYIVPILSLIFVITLVVTSTLMTLRYYNSGRMTVGMNPMPFWIFMAIVPVGSFVLATVISLKLFIPTPGSTPQQVDRNENT